MKKCIAIVTPVALTVSLFSSAAMAGPSERHHRGMYKHLELSAEQKQDIHQIHKQGREDKSIYREDFQALNQELKAYVQAVEWNETAVLELLTQKQQLQKSVSLQKAQNRHQVWLLLSETQREKLQNKEKSRSKGRRANKGVDKLARKLALTDEQQIQLSQYQTQMHSSKEAYKPQAKAFYQTQKTLIRSSAFNGESWQSQWDEYAQSQLQLGLAKARYRHQLWNLLDAEQQQKLEKMQSKRKHRGHKKDKSST